MRSMTIKDKTVTFRITAEDYELLLKVGKPSTVSRELVEEYLNNIRKSEKK